MSHIKRKGEINRNHHNINLNKLIKIELKTLAVKHFLLDTGTKPVLIERIKSFFKINTSVIIIQKNLRGYFARRLIKSLLVSSKIQEKFVNESDFYTLEPLSTIPFYLKFEYLDEQNFLYGFNIESLIHLYIRTGKVINPYNRNKVPICVMFEMFTVYGLLRIMFKSRIDSEIKFNIPSNFLFNIMSKDSVHSNEQLLESPTHIDYFNYESDGNIIQLLPIQKRTATNVNIMKNKLRNIQYMIDAARNLSLDRRVKEVFMEIDHFGHYTSSEWLSSLSNNNLKLFIVYLREIWLNKANLDNIDKYNICPFGDPFEIIHRGEYITTRNNILNHCVSIIENLVLSSPNINDKKLSALFVLTALTRVSSSARYELNWLYESIDW
jgi:hypothetical protein